MQKLIIFSKSGKEKFPEIQFGYEKLWKVQHMRSPLAPA
jgi:hypothetical protein